MRKQAEQPVQPAQAGDADAGIAVGGPVVEIAGDQAGQEEVETGDRGMRNGPAQGVEIGHQVGALVEADDWRAEPLAEAETEEDGDRQRDHDVAGNGGELTLAQAPGPPDRTDE